MKPLHAFFIIMLTGSAVFAEIDNSKAGLIDWINGKIVSKGKFSLGIDYKGEPIDDETGNRISISSSRDITYAKAKEIAVHNAALSVSDIRVDNEMSIRDLIFSHPEIRQKISHHIHEFSKCREISAEYLAASCELRLNIGFLIDAINIKFPENDFPLRDDIEITTKYTSLIIDTRGLNIKPMLLPEILNEAGLAVYSKNNISGRSAVKSLPVSYAYNDSEARKHKKAGAQPFYSIALKSLNGNPVISDEDIKRIYSHKDNLAFLKKCRVIFIIDR